MTVRVWVVIVHHKGEVLLERCLSALTKSAGVQLDTVIVHNGSEEVLSDHLTQRDGVHVLSLEEGRGFSEANNLGVQWAESNLPAAEFVLFLNNDAFVEPDCIRRLVAAIESRENLAVVGPRLEIADSDRYLNSLGLNVTRIGEAWDEGIGQHLDEYEGSMDDRDVLAVTGAALMIRAEVLELVGGWSEHYDFYQEDLDLCLKVRSKGFDVACITDARAHHLLSASSDEIDDFKVSLSWRNQYVLLLSRWPSLALLRWFPYLLIKQAVLYYRRRRVKAEHDAALQARAFRAALQRAPRALWERRRSGWKGSWTRLLKDPGTVPVITLPEREPSE